LEIIYVHARETHKVLELKDDKTLHTSKIRLRCTRTMVETTSSLAD